ncbi:MAG: immunoglobulin-like domain-containing protein, partial [Clostridium sp.]|uniref:immunoglobulin-like domain-containing protein n=1 Tax=Clostridium sp. TaxID=1506 RepID=UPI003EE7A333
NNSMLEVKAVDKEDGDLTNKVEYEGTVDTSKSGIYAVTAKVSDKDKLEASKVFTVVVEEKVEEIKPEKPDKKPLFPKPDTGDSSNLGLLTVGLVSLVGVIINKLK